MKRAVINPQECQNCQTCQVAELCPEKAIIREDPADKPFVNSIRCNGCMKCKAYCSYDAIQQVITPCH